MKVYYDLDSCPDYVRNQLPAKLKKFFNENLYYQTPTNYAQVIWNGKKVELKVFADDDFPLGYQTFSFKNI